MKYDNQLRYAAKIVKEYDGRSPLSSWLKDFFRDNKQMGSRDRKVVSGLVYGYYRIGHFRAGSVEEKILLGLFVTGGSSELADYFNSTHANLRSIADALTDHLSPEAIFPNVRHLSAAIDADAYARSFFIQPDLFLRIRPGFEKPVIEKLSAAKLSYRLDTPQCVALENSTKLQNVLDINREVVIQDRNSQRTASLLPTGVHGIWDCCAASGGKSIMAYDAMPEISLTVSDKRDSILHNLTQRFAEAGIAHYRAFVADLTDENDPLPAEKYDLVIADLPCTGSGTWARTPEQMYFFSEDRIEYYSQLQRRILSRVLPCIKPGGFLLYITCSVFDSENEQQVDYLMQEKGMRLISKEWFTGCRERADTLFGALLQAD